MCTCWDEGTVIVPDAQLSAEQLNRMTSAQMWDYFKPHMRARAGCSRHGRWVGAWDDSYERSAPSCDVVTSAERLTVVVEENYEQP